MDQHKQIRAIMEVQEAEAHATKKLADAGREKDRIVSEAREKATEIVSKALNESKEKKDSAIRKFAAELDERKKKAIESELRGSRNVGSRRLSAAKRKEVINRLVRIMVGE